MTATPTRAQGAAAVLLHSAEALRALPCPAAPGARSS